MSLFCSPAGPWEGSGFVYVFINVFFLMFWFTAASLWWVSLRMKAAIEGGLDLGRAWRVRGKRKGNELDLHR